MRTEQKEEWRTAPVYDEKTKTIQQRHVLLRVPVFVASDGEKFSSEYACLDHEKYLNGTKKKCPTCNGKGRWNTNYVPAHFTRDGEIEGYWEQEECKTCGGKGYLEKKETWE